MVDYTYMFRSELPLDEAWPITWDIFISAFDGSERVVQVFDKVVANGKFWIAHNEYGFAESDKPESAFTSPADNEAEFISNFIGSRLSSHDLPSLRLCVDITGFMRPHLMILVKMLSKLGVRRLDAIYSEPTHYAKREMTEFSDKAVSSVRQVAGFEGYVQNDTSNDILVIGAGYESHLIAEVAEDKEKADRVVIFGLPSLRADMYQQNRLRVREASDSIGDTATGKYFAPANNPFVAASVLSELVAKREAKRPVTNLYLAPLATKAQALGFALFYIHECEGKAVSILYPFSSVYSPDSSRGISRAWLCEMEL